MSDVTEISGIGPSKAETLAEEGYTSVEDIANAEHEALAEVDGVGEDRALEFIVGAENLLEDESTDDESEEEKEAFDLTPSEVSDEVEDLAEEDEEDDVSASVEEDEAQDSEEEEVAEEASAEPENELYEVELSFENKKQYDVYHAALMRHHERHYTGNQPTADAMQKTIDELDNFESVSYELTEYELNAVHSALSQLRTDYQGNNLISHMDEINVILDQVNEQRREYLF